MATLTMTSNPQQQQPSRLTLHETVSRKFDKTPDGQIFTRDLKTIFSLMVICLDLQEKPRAKSSKLFLPSKHTPFAFSVSDAVAAMAHLSLNIESSATSTTVSYAIKPDLAHTLLKTFMTAKLLHTPQDRTRPEPKDKVLLQPTPKGVAIVQSYCKVNGLKLNTQAPPIVRSEFNSMDLFLFERSSVTGTIIYSEYFVHLLFTRFLGSAPNVWSPTNGPDEIPSLEHRLQKDDEFDFSSFQNFTLTAIQAANNTLPGNKEVEKKPKKKRESPLAHAFFTNPDSDSHVQYYVSSKGVRMFENHKFQGNVTVKYCFSAKAGWQWLMDCTDIMYPVEASNIFSLFYKYGLIEPIILPPSTASSSKKHIAPSKTAFYAPSKKGYAICNSTPLNVAYGDEIMAGAQGLTLSNQAVVPDNSSSHSSDDERHKKLDSSQITIKTVLTDPGLRYLFRLHLEHEYCAENLDVYLEIRQFSKKMTILMSLMEMQQKKSSQKKTPSERALVRLINECLSVAYNIYSSYIAIGAPYQLNIDHLLRETVTEAVLHATSPLKVRFDEISRPISISMPDSPQRAHLPPSKAVELPPATKLSPIPSQQTVKSPRMMNNKNLSIEIPSHDITPQPVSTPTPEELNRSLALLHKLFPLFDQVGKQILKMLEFDSFPKFLASDTLRGAVQAARP